MHPCSRRQPLLMTLISFPETVCATFDFSLCFSLRGKNFDTRPVLSKRSAPPRFKEARNSFFGLGVYLLKSKFRIEDELRFP